jgi:hypothetical protein
MNTALATKPKRDCRQPSKCRDCGAPILWVTWPRSGKKMPVNAEPKPAPYGQILLGYRPAENQLIAEMSHGRNAQGRKLYESHWATCPGERARQMRKDRPPAGSARSRV